MSYYNIFKVSDNTRSNRYRNCLLLEDKETGDRLLETRDIIGIPESPKDIFHTVEYHEIGRLDLIAHKYYKNALFWWIIAQANDIYDPFTGMYTGMLLRIPTIETLYGYGGILL